VPTNPHEVPLASRDGMPFFIAPHPVLAVGKVRHVGEAIAAVVAETLAQAMDAAEQIAVVYEPLPAVARRAGTGGASRLGGARHQFVHRFRSRRHSRDRPRFRAGGAYRPARNGDQPRHRRADGAARGGRRVRRKCSAIHRAHQRRAAWCVSTCPEFALVAWAARRVGRPIKWTCERRDAFATDFHGLDLTSAAELALDKDGHFLALRAVNTSNLGSSAISFVPLAKGIAVSSSVYDIRCSSMRGRAVVTNTGPTSAYRSAGRPEVVFVLERLIDIACRRPPRFQPSRDPPAQPRQPGGDAVPEPARPRL
jgi:aerobic carbon-monoxide dehydrogenase large subunit